MRIIAQFLSKITDTAKIREEGTKFNIFFNSAA